VRNNTPGRKYYGDETFTPHRQEEKIPSNVIWVPPRYSGTGGLEKFHKLDEDEEEKRMMKKKDYGFRAGERRK
jgi:hypothetical protein